MERDKQTQNGIAGGAGNAADGVLSAGAGASDGEGRRAVLTAWLPWPPLRELGWGRAPGEKRKPRQGVGAKSRDLGIGNMTARNG